MKKILVVPFMIIVFFTSLSFSDVFYGENSKDWKPYHNTVIGKIDYKYGRHFKFKGDGIKSGYILGAWEGFDGAWNDREAKVISWDMKYKETYIVYIRIMTKMGARYLYYTAKDKDLGKSANGILIHHGLGSHTTNGVWNNFSRNLEDDLQEFEPENELVAVNAFLIYGSGEVRNITTDSFFKYLKVIHPIDKLGAVNISLDVNKYHVGAIPFYIEYGETEEYGNRVKMSSYTKNNVDIGNLKLDTTYHFRIISDNETSQDYTFKTLSSNRVVYEDAEDGDIDGWRSKSKGKKNYIKNVYTENGNRAISFLGQIVLGGFADHPNAWHDKKHNIISWDTKTYGVKGGGFVVHIRVMTKNGARYLYYTPVNYNMGFDNNLKGAIHHGLGYAKDDKWHSFSRDLEKDLQDYEPHNKLLEVNGFFITNTNSQVIYVDDIKMYNRNNLSYKDYLDTNKMIGFIYTASMVIDKNKIPIENILLKEYRYSNYNLAKKVPKIGTNKIKYLFNNLTPNTKYYYRIVYKDGSISKERDFTTLSANQTNYWEKDESLWRIYGKDKSVGTITRNNWSVELNGDGLKTGYILGGLENDHRAWRNSSGNRLKLYFYDIRYNYKSDNMIYIRVMTKNGTRFLCYHTNPKKFGIDKSDPSYIHYPINSINRYDIEVRYYYYCFRINIENDLKHYEPDNKLLEINAIIIYGDLEVYKDIVIDKMYAENDLEINDRCYY